MSKKATWYDKGFGEALQGLPADPPMEPKHSSHKNYLDGYRDGERQAELDAEREDAAAANAPGRHI